MSCGQEHQCSGLLNFNSFAKSTQANYSYLNSKQGIGPRFLDTNKIRSNNIAYIQQVYAGE